MKLQAELEHVVQKFQENKEQILAHANWLKEVGGYKDFDTRLAWDALYAMFGSAWMCELYRKYDCNDAHITTLAKKAIKQVVL